MDEIIATMKVLPMSQEEKLDMAVDMLKDEGYVATDQGLRVLGTYASTESMFDIPDEMFT